jgi:hypothetical protein
LLVPSSSSQRTRGRTDPSSHSCQETSTRRTGGGWDITNLSNCTLIGCRSERNNTGYSIANTNEGTGSGGGKLIGCSTDRNQQHGIAITTGNNTGRANLPCP